MSDHNEPRMLSCEGCGHVQEAGCNCGLPYIPLKPLARVQAAWQADPKRSIGAVAEATGTSKDTAYRGKPGTIVRNRTKDTKMEQPASDTHERLAQYAELVKAAHDLPPEKDEDFWAFKAKWENEYHLATKARIRALLQETST